MKKSLKKGLAIGVLATSLATRLFSIEPSDLEINLNYEHKSELVVPEGKRDYSIYSNSQLWGYGKTNLEESERLEVESVLKDSTSYSEFIENSKKFSEKQNIAYLAAQSGWMALHNYNEKGSTEQELLSQDEWFSIFHQSITNEEDLSLGVCRHIAGYTEQAGKNLGETISSVIGVSSNGVGHVYNVLDADQGTTIIDYFTIFQVPTENIEKTLASYQKLKGTTEYDHTFIEDGKFKYKFSTEDGINLEKFIEYDPTSSTSKNLLLNGIKNSSNGTINLNFGNVENSFGINLYGGFLKVGQILGSEYSPMQNTSIIQTGFNRNFNLEKILLQTKASLIYGNIIQDKEIENNNPIGMSLDFATRTNWKNFNMSGRLAGTLVVNQALNNVFYDDALIESGMSYKFETNKWTTIPYAISQFKLGTNEIGTYNMALLLEELEIGNKLKYNNKENKFTLGASFILRPYEIGGIAGLEFSNEYIELGISGEATASTYRPFNPDKINLETKLKVNLKNLQLGINHEFSQHNYNGEKSLDNSFEISGKLSY